MRGLTGIALAGPGPQTWLYRVWTARSSSLPCRSPRSCGTFSTSVSSSSSGSERQVQRTRLHQRRSEHSAPGAVPNGLPHSIPDSSDAVRLRPPPDYPIDDHLHLLHLAMKSHKLDAALASWSSLIDLGATSRLAPSDFAGISTFFLDLFSRRGCPNLGKMAASHPEKFGILRGMVIESGARDHWQGLHTFMLKLVEAGRPADVVTIFTKCKERMRELQGIDAKNLVSWDREARLAARLKGEGLKSLMMVNVAALTLLEALDEHTLFGMLDTQADLRPNARFDFNAIHRIFRRFKDGEALFERFQQNVDKLILALQCFHPNALVGRILMLGHSKNAAGLSKLYNDVLSASIGPRAFIRPRDLVELDVQGSAYTNIPLPPIIWWQFIKAFEWRGDVNRIATMIDRDMPERNLQPTAHFLSLAMLHMAIIAARPSVPSDVKNQARAWADEYWRRLSSAGWHTRDEAFSRRIRVLGILGWDEPRLRGEIERLYTAVKDGHLAEVGPRSRAAFVEFFLIQNKLNEAFRVITTLPPSHVGDQRNLDPAIATFIRRLALGRWSPSEKLSACGRALRLVAKNEQRLGSPILGPLLSIQLEGGLPLKRTVDTILEHTLTPQQSEHGILPWTSVLSGLLTKWTQKRMSSMVELEAGLYILRRASAMQLYGHTRTRTVAMWITFLRSAARSDLIGVEQRQEFIDSALDLFPGGKEAISTSMLFEVIHLLLARPDGSGFAEAWEQWERLISHRDVGAVLWSKMLKLLLDRGRDDFALDLVKVAWEEKKVGLEEGFWLRAEAAGLTEKLGKKGQIDQDRTAMIGRGRRARGKIEDDDEVGDIADQDLVETISEFEDEVMDRDQ
ncbi:hypothetical protein IAR55_003777 [Kwoniella newhampshirensis]|uniref:Pentatricopeptide repeat domain-containing protein n=1 Tax=Kwoniella newhampshirensis TaxID=1651941 RepID=A0AAW0YYE2_9TREE